VCVYVYIIPRLLLIDADDGLQVSEAERWSVTL